MQSEHLLLFVPFRETVARAVLDGAARAGATLTVVSARPEAWFAPWPCVRGWLPSVDPDAAGVAALLERAAAIHAEHPIARCVPSSESSVEAAASVNAVLGLGGTSPEAALCSRDKHRMRQALRDHGVGVPAFRRVRAVAEFEAAVRDIGFPCVAKPSRAAGSDGVARLERGADLPAAWAFSAGVRQMGGGAPEVLVEEYVPGPEYSVEMVVAAATAHVAGITEKTTEPEPYFNEVMHLFPAPLSPEDEAAVVRTARDAVAALGITDGGAHLELRLSPRGPVVIECAARLAGDSIPELVKLATGVDLYHCVARQALGLPFSVEPVRRRFSGVRFIQAAEEGILRAARFRPEAILPLRGLVAHGVSRTPGELLARPPRGPNIRLAWAIAVGRAPADVRAALDGAEAALEYSVYSADAAAEAA